MKNKINNIVWVVLLALLGGCNLLDQNSPNDLDAATAIKDAASAEAALLGVYSSMQRDAYYGGSFQLMTEPLCNNANTGGFQVLSLTQLGDKVVTSSNLIVEETWVAIYRVVANCNFLLEALPNITDLDEGRAKAIEGQVRTIRALAHFDLLRSFGEHFNSDSRFGVPIIDRVQTIEDRPGRNTVRECYTFIINELEAAAALLDENDTSVQFVNANTANALLARVRLYQGDRPAALAAANKVLAQGAYALLPTADYGTIFSGRRSSESIFELTFDNQNRSGFNGLTYSRDEALRTEIFYLAAKDLEDFFALRPGDVRAALLNYDPTANDATILPDGRTQKYRGEDTKDNPAYIVRVAEMHLVRAEARGFPDGIEDLNNLRAQRGLPALAPADAASFVGAVLEERRAEFNFEGLFYGDLARLGLYADFTGQEAFRAILPVPLREITASDGAVEQNEGY
jgi:starch-binding outer membrane protein, SusD/RagB family